LHFRGAIRRFLTELDKGVWSCSSIDFVTVLVVEFLRKIVQESIGVLLVEVSVTEREEADILLDDIATQNKGKNNLSVQVVPICIHGNPYWNM
jgi:hypothetical protein